VPQPQATVIIIEWHTDNGEAVPEEMVPERKTIMESRSKGETVVEGRAVMEGPTIVEGHAVAEGHAVVYGDGSPGLAVEGAPNTDTAVKAPHLG
jgi:hypothetical protein